MNDETLHESLSALVDGELSPAQAEQVLDALSRDARLREQWRRHHLISAVLAGHGVAPRAGDDVAQRVAARLDAAPVAIAARAAPRRRRYWMPAALAASVATAAVLASLAWLAGGDGSPREHGPQRVAAIPEQAIERGPAAGIVESPRPCSARTGVDARTRTRMTWNDTRPAVEARLNAYLLNHNEYLAGGVRGMLPYARVVGYDARD